MSSRAGYSEAMDAKPTEAPESPVPLDNIMWNTLVGPHARFAAGDGAVRRLAPGFAPLVGVEGPEHPDFAARVRCFPLRARERRRPRVIARQA